MCQHELKPVSDDNDEQVTGGLVLKSYGSFGSEVWDPMWNPEYLCFALCDDCLLGASEFIRVRRRVRRVEEPLVKDEPWRGNEESHS
jgi:hypothetical protein